MDNTDIRSDINSASKGVPQIKELLNNPQDPDEKISFGAVVAVNGTRITIAQMGVGDALPDWNNTKRIQLGSMNANYYLYDASKSPRSRCGIGARGDIYVDPMLAGDAGQSTGETIVYGSFSQTNPVAGMLDYVFVRDYQRTGDVVIYMQRQYPYTIQ